MSNPGRPPLTVGGLVERYSILFAWAGVIVTFTALRPETFGTLRNFQTILGAQSALVIVTLGVLLVLAAGEFDLSIGSALGLGASLFAYLTVRQGVVPAVAVVIVLVCGLLFGLLNGVLVVHVGVPSMVATLGTGTLLAGVTLGVVGPSIQAGIPSGFVDLVTDRWLGLPHAFYFATVLCAVTWYVLEHTPFGRYLNFVGRGREVARLAGLRVGLLRIVALASAATAAALAGIVVAGTSGSVQSGVGNTFLLPVYAAAFLGATTIRPGSFNAWGAYVSVYFLLTGITGLQLLGAAGWPEQVFYGGSLVLAVSLSRLAARARLRRARPATEAPSTGGAVPSERNVA